jgi:hypothetical protein
MTNLATILGAPALVDFVLGWRETAYHRLTRQGLERDAAIAGANAEAKKWTEEFAGGTFCCVDDRPYVPPRTYLVPFVPPAKVHRQERLL